MSAAGLTVELPSRVLRAIEAGCELAECPVDHPSAPESMMWVDCEAGSLHTFTGGMHDEHHLVRDEPLTGLSVLEDGQLLALGGRRIFGFDVLRLRRTGDLAAIPDSPLGVTFNDAKAGPDGRLWAGTVCRGVAFGGALWSYRPDEGLVKRRTGITHGNGLGWNRGATSMWFVDSGERTLSRAAWDLKSGSIMEPDLVVRFDPELGIPDGLAVDIEDHVWLAMWGGHGVLRIDPHGRILGLVPLPERNVTSCAFVGRNLEGLAVTTAKDEVDPTAPGGDVYVLDVGVAGALVPLLPWSAPCEPSTSQSP